MTNCKVYYNCPYYKIRLDYKVEILSNKENVKRQKLIQKLNFKAA